MYVSNRNCDFIPPIDDRKRNWKAVREINRADYAERDLKKRRR